jgi:hypothetical protein
VGGTNIILPPNADAPVMKNCWYDFAKLIWQLASPKWDFRDATFERTAAAFNNPDHVSIVIHNYRWRLGAPRPDDSSYAKKFSGKYAHRIINGGIGHNQPQEAPQAFAKAVVDVDGF